jgi:hypothetical protein
VLERALDALRRGLAEQALTVLMESDVLEFGPPGAQLEIELLLTTGRLAEARRLLSDPNANLREGLGTTAVGPTSVVAAYDWDQLLLAVGEGDSQAADKQLQALSEFQEEQVQRQIQQLLFAPPMGVVGLGLSQTSRDKPLAVLALGHLQLVGALQATGTLAPSLQGKANLMVLRGLLALEAGNTALAEAQFRQAVAIGFPPSRFLPLLALLGTQTPLEAAALLPPSYRAASGSFLDFTGRPAAIHYLQLMDEAAARK